MHKAMAEQAVTPGASAFLHPNVDLARAAETAAHAPNKNEDAHGHDVPVQYVDESGDEPDDTNADLVEIEVFDLSHEEARIYHYPTDGDDIEVEVDEPIKLYVRQDSGTHYVETVDGYGVVVPAGWYYIDVQPRHGERPFKF
jgi:hypothetical protein